MSASASSISNTALATYLSIAPQSAEETVLRLLVELGANAIGGDEGSLLVHDPAARKLVFAINTAQDGSSLIGQQVPLGEGLVGLAAATGEVQIGAPIYRGVAQPAERKGSEPEAVIAAPMSFGDTLLGVITAVSFKHGKRFTSADAALYARIGAVAAIVVQQRQHIQAMEALAAKSSPARPATPAEQAHYRVIDAIARLTRLKPERLGEVAKMLEDVCAVVGSSEAT